MGTSAYDELHTGLGDERLAERLSEVARDLEQQADPAATMANVVRAAVELVPGASDASISLIEGRRRVTSHAASGELPRAVDALQEQTGQGPCLNAVFERQTVRVPDMRSEQRWPQFTQRAYEAGAGSMLSLRLFVEGDDLGALNLYSAEPGAFDSQSEHVGLLFASHAAVAYAGSQKQSGLVRAVETRQLIGQAQGILMERNKITADQAFALLVSASQHTNVKLREVADVLVQSGELPVPQQRSGSPDP